MKRFVAFLISFVVIVMFSGCDYYDDVSISVTRPEPDSNGLVAYLAGVSTEKNAARINLLRYELKAIQDGQIKIVLPETIKDKSGTEFAINAFGGAIGTNAPLQKFELIIHIQEGAMSEDPIALTIDVGSLPLDTSYWKAVQICFQSDGSVAEVPLESVVFLSDAPLSYKAYLKEEATNGSVSDATNSDQWYEMPKREYLGGEKVIIRLKHPENGVERSLAVTHTPAELVEVRDEYIQYEFIMPYHSVRITIVDEKN